MNGRLGVTGHFLSLREQRVTGGGIRIASGKIGSERDGGGMCAFLGERQDAVFRLQHGHDAGNGRYLYLRPPTVGT